MASIGDGAAFHCAFPSTGLHITFPSIGVSGSCRPFMFGPYSADMAL